MIWKKIGKWTLLLLIAVLGVLVGLSHCVSFGIKQEKVDLFFQKRGRGPDYRSYRIGDRTISYVSVGDETRPLVLFVHGSPGSWTNFLSFMADDELLARARIASVDRPGFGGSDRGKTEKSIVGQAAEIAPILRENRSGKPAILVGHSLGGPVIARIAMDYPDLVGGLIMVAPSIDPEMEKTKWYQIPADWLIFSWMLPTDLITTNREILPLKAELEAMLPLWRQIKTPTTVIQGEKDKLVPPGNADFAKRVLTHAPLNIVRVPDLNHFVPWTRPDLIKNAILDHLNTLEQGSPNPDTSAE